MAEKSVSTSLDNLNDIVVSEPVPFWPPAPGWYLLAAVVAAVGISLSLRWWRRFREDHYRREATRELKRLESETALPQQRAAAAAALPGLVKRVALTAWGRTRVAALDGESYLELLDQSVDGHPFLEGAGRHLPRLSYDPGYRNQITNAELRELFDVLKDFIANHQASKGGETRRGGQPVPC